MEEFFLALYLERSDTLEFIDPTLPKSLMDRSFTAKQLASLGFPAMYFFGE